MDDRVKGLDMGANDYLTKPFDFLELETRIRTLSRIAYIQTVNTLTCRELTLNTAAKEAACGAVKISLTKKEYAILEYMMLHKNQVADAKQILDHAWDSSVDFFPDTLKTTFTQSRKSRQKLAAQKILSKMCAALAIWWWMNDA